MIGRTQPTPTGERRHTPRCATSSGRHQSSGPTTFLFTDIEDSTRHWETAFDQMLESLAQHDRILRRAIERSGGTIFAATGDGFAAAFLRVADAVHAAVDIERAVAAVRWATPAPLLVRAGISTGRAVARDGNHFGPAVIRAARIAAAAHGGQILIGRAAAAALADDRTTPDRVELVDLGLHRLRGLDEPEQLHQVVVPGLPRRFPAPRADADTTIAP
jgi:class 3 adenylate cyclase